MTDKKLKVFAEALDERRLIMNMPQASTADRVYYEAMIQSAYYFGYDVRVDISGTHKLIKM